MIELSILGMYTDASGNRFYDNETDNSTRSLSIALE
jgi:hypothetical protein